MFDPIRNHRRSIRNKKHDYSSPGWYFVTICTQNRTRYFGRISNKTILLNDPGKMIGNVLDEIPNRFEMVRIDAYVIMPDHFHVLIQILENSNVSLFDIVGAFKSITTVKYVNGVKNNGWQPFDKKLWQFQYHDRIIRNETHLSATRDYINNHP